MPIVIVANIIDKYDSISPTKWKLEISSPCSSSTMKPVPLPCLVIILQILRSNKRFACVLGVISGIALRTLLPSSVRQQKFMFVEQWLHKVGAQHTDKRVVCVWCVLQWQREVRYATSTERACASCAWQVVCVCLKSPLASGFNWV